MWHLSIPKIASPVFRKGDSVQTSSDSEEDNSRTTIPIVVLSPKWLLWSFDVQIGESQTKQDYISSRFHMRVTMSGICFQFWGLQIHEEYWKIGEALGKSYEKDDRLKKIEKCASKSPEDLS